jgi:hypothetical protein
MSDKQEKIKKMLEMQAKFIAYEREHGVSAEEYFVAPEGHELHGYRQEYLALADDVVNMAHEEKGSHR